MNLGRRQFNQWLMAMGAMGLVRPRLAASAAPRDTRQLFRMAYANPGREGRWTLTDVEGAVPRDLQGSLVRVAPGESERFGTKMRHFFDGDPFMTAFRFDDGRVHLDARFLETPQRVEEQKAGRMLFSEFGTLAPGVTTGETDFDMKNQASVNLIAYDGRLLGLSEGGHPIAVDPGTLAYQGNWDFHGSLPGEVSFTAHPKLDPKTGEGYGYGVSRDDTMALVVYRMNGNGRLEELHRVPRDGYYMIHDMAITEHYLIFIIPPVILDFSVLFSGRATLADAIRYAEERPTRTLILRRDGTGEPVEIESPPSMVFHNGNAFENDGKIEMVSLISPDGSILRQLHAFAEDRIPKVAPTAVQAITIDPRTQTIQRSTLGHDEEFPRFDERLLGKRARYLYTLGGDQHRPFLQPNLVRRDLEGGQTLTVDNGPTHTLEEAVFVPTGEDEAQGWLLNRGFDGERNETYLDIREAASLERVARVWTGTHHPLGFHGNYVA